jgi:hypothetical protein
LPSARDATVTVGAYFLAFLAFFAFFTVFLAFLAAFFFAMALTS